MAVIRPAANKALEQKFYTQHGAESTLVLAPRDRGAPSEGRARDKLEEEKRRIAALRGTLLGSAGYDFMGDPSGLAAPTGGY